MSSPALPPTEAGEVLLLCTYYEDGQANWGGVLGDVGGRREGDVIVLGEGGARLRVVEGIGWDYLHGGDVPALVPDGGRAAPVAVLVDIPVVAGGGDPLLVDLVAVPGRGVRVPASRLGEILAGLLRGEVRFEDLVRETDVRGVYQGDAGRPAFPAPEPSERRSFPPLPASSGALLVRTCFDDDEGWRALLDDVGGIDEDGWVGADLDWDEIDADDYPLTAQVVEDRRYEGLLPGEVPALVPPEEHATLVALADARTFAWADRPLTAVDLYDTPGQPAVLPRRVVGSMAANLEISNMDFHDFVLEEGSDPWW
ncbi:DUF6924 domain-containing protein [Actinomadura litoris]|uniref:DUF6924 domain-containing protein n=1 Tax=Actinomadura litoris TaxID=2678616 RepID=UPI001FA7157F|nr:hypothetical protein [Actinomadura litoris]